MDFIDFVFVGEIVDLWNSEKSDYNFDFNICNINMYFCFNYK